MQVEAWLVGQAPVVIVLVLGFVALWRSNQKQQAKLQDLLDNCWSRLLQHLDRDHDA